MNSLPDIQAVRHMQAWILLVGALGLHVIDEAATGFLGFYNPLVRSLRLQWSWFPMPTFTFGVWLTGLAVLVIGLAFLAPAVRRNIPGTSLASWALSGIMFLNGVGHLGGSIYLRRWLPGATSAPLLIVASVLLAKRTWDRRLSTALRAARG
jgi:hypothetical protein